MGGSRKARSSKGPRKRSKSKSKSKPRSKKSSRPKRTQRARGKTPKPPSKNISETPEINSPRSPRLDASEDPRTIPIVSNEDQPITLPQEMANEDNASVTSSRGTTKSKRSRKKRTGRKAGIMKRPKRLMRDPPEESKSKRSVQSRLKASRASLRSRKTTSTRPNVKRSKVKLSKEGLAERRALREELRRKEAFEAIQKLSKELAIRNEQLAGTGSLIRLSDHELINLERRMLKLREWVLYTACRNIPDFLQTNDVREFLSYWLEDVTERGRTLERVIKHTPDILQLMAEMKCALEAPPKFLKPKNWNEVGLMYRHFQEKEQLMINLGTLDIIQNLNSELYDPELGQFNQSIVTRSLIHSLWGNMSPSGSSFGFSFPESGFKFRLPQPLMGIRGIYRVLRLEFDHFSDFSDSYFDPGTTNLMQKSIAIWLQFKQLKLKSSPSLEAHSYLGFTGYPPEVQLETRVVRRRKKRSKSRKSKRKNRSRTASTKSSRKTRRSRRSRRSRKSGRSSRRSSRHSSARSRSISISSLSSDSSLTSRGTEDSSVFSSEGSFKSASKSRKSRMSSRRSKAKGGSNKRSKGGKKRRRRKGKSKGKKRKSKSRKLRRTKKKKGKRGKKERSRSRSRDKKKISSPQWLASEAEGEGGESSGRKPGSETLGEDSSYQPVSQVVQKQERKRRPKRSLEILSSAIRRETREEKKARRRREREKEDAEDVEEESRKSMDIEPLGSKVSRKSFSPSSLESKGSSKESKVKTSSAESEVPPISVLSKDLETSSVKSSTKKKSKKKKKGRSKKKKKRGRRKKGRRKRRKKKSKKKKRKKTSKGSKLSSREKTPVKNQGVEEAGSFQVKGGPDLNEEKGETLAGEASDVEGVAQGQEKVQLKSKETKGKGRGSSKRRSRSRKRNQSKKSNEKSFEEAVGEDLPEEVRPSSEPLMKPRKNQSKKVKKGKGRSKSKSPRSSSRSKSRGRKAKRKFKKKGGKARVKGRASSKGSETSKAPSSSSAGGSTISGSRSTSRSRSKSPGRKKKGKSRARSKPKPSRSSSRRPPKKSKSRKTFKSRRSKRNRRSKRSKMSQKSIKSKKTQSKILLDQKPSQNSSRSTARSTTRSRVIPKTHPHELNLRNYTVLGGIFDFSLLQVPPQEKERGHWFIHTIEPDQVLKSIEYKAEFHLLQEPNSDEVRRASQRKLSQDIRALNIPILPKSLSKSEEAKLNEEFKKDWAEAQDIFQREKQKRSNSLLRISIRLSERVLWAGVPSPVRWIPEKRFWSKGSFHDIIFNDSEMELGFGVEQFGIFGLATNRWAHFPLREWEIKPFGLNCARISLETPYMALTLELRDDVMALGSIFSGYHYKSLENELQNKFMKLRPFIKSLRSHGLDLFPESDTYLFIDGVTPKEYGTEMHLYQCMALVAGAFNFRSSDLNQSAGSEKMIYSIREGRDQGRGDGEFDYKLVASSDHETCFISEGGQKYPDEKFMADCLHLCNAVVTPDGVQRIQGSSPIFVETLRQLLMALRPLSYS